MGKKLVTILGYVTLYLQNYAHEYLKLSYNRDLHFISGNIHKIN